MLPKMMESETDVIVIAEGVAQDVGGSGKKWQGGVGHGFQSFAWVARKGDFNRCTRPHSTTIQSFSPHFIIIGGRRPLSYLMCRSVDITQSERRRFSNCFVLQMKSTPMSSAWVVTYSKPGSSIPS